MNKKEILINKNNTQYSISLPSKALKSFKIEGKKTYNKFNMLNDKEAIKIKEKKTFLHAKQEPFIFKKNESPVKSLRYINNDTGKIRHYTPGAQEWFNNIYSYNENYTKLLPVADKNLMLLLNSYFNFFLNPIVLKTKRIANRYRQLSVNKVFVGKGELKHTNEKVIITSYVYNVEQFYLKSEILKEARSLYYPKEELKKIVDKDINDKIIITYNRRFTLEEYLNFPDHSIWHINTCFKLFWKKYVELIGQKKIREEEKKLKGDFNMKNYVSFMDNSKAIFLEAFSDNTNIKTTMKNSFEPLMQLVEKKEENIEKLLTFENEISKLKTFYNNFDMYMTMAEDLYKKTLKRFIYLLMVNNAKFEKPFIRKLTHLVKNIYNKEIEFNIVNLYKIHLNSDIYTQAVSLKLRNRDNNLYSILTGSLNKVKLPNENRINEKYHKANRDEYLINKIRNVYINSMLNDNVNVDPLNNLLLGYFPLANSLVIEGCFARKRSSVIKRPVTLYKYIIKTLKHIKLAGIRVEGKGRLTRRFTAARSIFKVKWKGGLKNVDSSFKGLPTIMLRGDRKSNVQYSILSSKNRNGAFGIKGWISSK
jgi:hypothetical protein